MSTCDNQITQNNDLIDLRVLIKNFFKIFIRTWQMMLLLVILGALGMGLYQFVFVDTTYTASETYSVNLERKYTIGSLSDETFFDNKTAEQMTKTLPYILTSDVLQRKVAKELGVSEIQGSVHASVAENTNFLTLSVTDTDPLRAFNTLQAVVKSYPSVSEVIIGKVNMDLLDGTGVPEKPDDPGRWIKNILKGAFLGFFFGCLWCLLAAWFRKTVSNEADCVEKINKKCMGDIPTLHTKVRSKKNSHMQNIMDQNIDPEFMESFRILRNRVELAAEKNHAKTILITSALPGEGKSTIAVNLALSLAQAGKKVALIDCDLRHPSDGAILNCEEKDGLVEYLKGEASLEECILNGKDIFNHNLPFVFLRGGKSVADGTKYLAGRKMESLIHKMGNLVDYLILDTVPAGMLTDASVLAQYVDGTMFVVRKDYAKVDHIIEAMEQITESGSEIYGCVLNGENM